MHSATHYGLNAETADGHDAMHSHSRRREYCGELCQGYPAPAEHCAFLLNEAACELIGRIEACPDDQHFFRWGASLKPCPRTSDTAVAH
jgi:hypothetical protein